jgi:hypothetical protein
MSTEYPINIRPATYRDLKELAELHYLCSSVQPGAFMFKLGRGFILEYYRILLKEKTSLVLCADAGNDGIVGLICAHLDAKESLKWLKSESYRMFLAALPALARQPLLIKKILSRAKSLWGLSSGDNYVIGSGARIAYWGWSPDYPSRGHSVFLLKTLLKNFENNHVNRVRFEVDRLNRKVEVIHRLLGAKVVREFKTPDGRSRMIMEYILGQRKEISRGIF